MALLVYSTPAACRAPGAEDIRWPGTLGCSVGHVMRALAAALVSLPAGGHTPALRVTSCRPSCPALSGGVISQLLLPL